MATATNKAHRAKRGDRSTGPASGSAALEFLIVEDNGGRYHWTIVDGPGQTLGKSGSFASYDEAEHAARVVRDSAGIARLEFRAADDPPADLLARRDAMAEDDSDAERWLDEGGSFSSEAVRQWPARR